MNKEVVLLDRHREIFLPRSDTPISSTRLENTQYNGPIILHEQVEGGPKTVARLPMTTDSLTLLKRLQHRKRLELEQNDPDSTPLGSGTRRLVTSDGHDDRLSIHRAEKSTRRTSSSSDRDRVGEDQRSLRTLATTTKSYNTSADREQHSGREVMLCEPMFEGKSCSSL